MVMRAVAPLLLALAIAPACGSSTQAPQEMSDGDMPGRDVNPDGVPYPTQSVVSLAWPAGVTSPDEEVVAADYLLACRGYNWNQLEDPSPADFMNLKSYNSHEHAPFPPADLKTVVDAAVAQGKWFNLVLHTTNNDNGAIVYSK